MCMGLIADICNNNTALMFAWSQKVEMVKQQLLKKWGVVLLFKMYWNIFGQKIFLKTAILF